MFEIIIKSIIVGLIAGGAVAAGAARMFYAPGIQGMGAFRTLGELNACNGDPISHFSFGSSFLITSAAASMGGGALTGDVLHRIVPNFAAGFVGIFSKDKSKKPYEKPAQMMIAGALVGVVVFVALNTFSALIPEVITSMARDILTPAVNNMMLIVMPLIFLWAAFDSGMTTGAWSIILGGLMQMISGNALPGIIFGILIGYTIQEQGLKGKTTQILIAIILVIMLLIAYFRGFHETMLNLFIK